MKIRMDFVTNSSSSSFCVVLTLIDKEGNLYRMSSDLEDCEFEDVPETIYDKFTGDLNNVKKYSSVEELCRYLVDAIDSYLSEDEYFCDEFENSKEDFVLDVTNNVKSVDDIAKIVVERIYNAWGEYADLVADNDSELCSLASKVLSSTGDEKEQAKAEMLEYIQSSNGNRALLEFGVDYEDFRYYWYGGDKALEMLSERLCSNYGPGEVSGTEHKEIDMETGIVTEYAEFDLQ